MNGVATYPQQNKKGICPLFSLITQVYKIENFKQAKEVTFIIHDPHGKLKEHIQKVGFIWIYSHEDMLVGEHRQQHVLVKSQISTLDQMNKIDKEVEIRKSIVEKSRSTIEWKNIIRIEDVEKSSSSYSMSMYNLDFDKEDSEMPSLTNIWKSFSFNS